MEQIWQPVVHINNVIHTAFVYEYYYINKIHNEY